MFVGCGDRDALPLAREVTPDDGSVEELDAGPSDPADAAPDQPDAAPPRASAVAPSGSGLSPASTVMSSSRFRLVSSMGLGIDDGVRSSSANFELQTVSIERPR